MVKKLYITAIALVGAFMVSFTGGDECSSDAFMEGCASRLDQFNYIKTFMVQPNEPGDKIKTKYILSKGSKYRFVTCDQDDPKNKMKFKLYDRNKKMIGTNYLSSSQKYYPQFDYQCTATGVYYIEASFKPSKVGCGVIILGFTR